VTRVRLASLLALACGVLVGAAVGACTEVVSEFSCDADKACVLDGVAGFCEPSGHCSFDDEDCGTGRRYGSDAGEDAGACVGPWVLQLGGPFDETAPRLALDRVGQLHVATSFADRLEVAGSEQTAMGGTDVLHAAISPRTGRVLSVEVLGGPGEDLASGLGRWGKDAVILTAVFGADAQILGASVPSRGSVLAKRGEAGWASAIPLETDETRALQIQAQAVDGAGTIIASGVAFGAPLDLGAGVGIDSSPLGFGGFIATFTGEGDPKTLYAVELDGGVTESCASAATDGDRRFATSCVGYFADEEGVVYYSNGYPILVIGSIYDGFPIPFAALPETTVVSFVGFGVDGSLIVGGYFEGSTTLPESLFTGEEVTLTAAGDVDGFIAQLYVEIGAEGVGFVTGSVAQIGGAGAGVFPLALEAAEDGSLHVAGTYYGTVDPFGESAGGLDAFALSVSLDGTLANARRYGGVLDDLASTIAVDASGEAFVGGTFQGEITIDGVTLQSTGGTDAFVAPALP